MDPEIYYSKFDGPCQESWKEYFASVHLHGTRFNNPSMVSIIVVQQLIALRNIFLTRFRS